MKLRFTLLLLPLLLLRTLVLSAAEPIPFNLGWRFLQQDAAGAEQPDFDDSQWRRLNLPHDWSIEGSYSRTAYGTDWQSGFLPCGIGWYRKELFVNDLPPSGKRLYIRFDAVYLNSTVWLNGVRLGTYYNGYLPFEYDLTPYLRAGRNVIAVRVDHSRPLTERWYTGSGINRSVWLLERDALFIPMSGVNFSTENESARSADYRIATTLRNTGSERRRVTLVSMLVDRRGRCVARQTTRVMVAAGEEREIVQRGRVDSPALWSPEHPEVYMLESLLLGEGDTLDRQSCRVGIRRLCFSSDSGFWLNGCNVKIRGVCDHNSAGAFGTAVPAAEMRRRLLLLKQMGVNAIRTAHNPFAEEFYTICDTLGILVLDEFTDGWDTPKSRDGSRNFAERCGEELVTFLKRDRNHPCIFAWSIGNEVANPTPERQRMMADLCRRYGNRRPVTQGGTDPTRNMSADYAIQTAALDIVGFNGNGEEAGELERFRANFPERCAIGTEMPHTYQTRGVYRTRTTWRRRDFPAPWEIGDKSTWEEFSGRVYPIADLSERELFSDTDARYQSSYDNASVRIGARHQWQRTESFPWFMGEFRWGSFDYLGEAVWPKRAENFGVLDLCGFPKDHYYLYQSLWTARPMVHLLPHWSWHGMEGQTIPVVAYTNCGEVELLLNGRSLGRRPYVGEQLVWQVPYEPGELEAVAFTDGREVARTRHVTAQEPHGFRVKMERTVMRADGADILHLEVDIVDRNGNFVPDACPTVTLSASDPELELVADNGDPCDLTPYRSPQRRAFNGKLLVVVRPTLRPGTRRITLSAAGMEPRTVEFRVEETAAGSSYDRP